MTTDLVVLGGGPAGYYGAIRAATQAPAARVLLLEATGSPLQKVRISGGGRCNVTHHQFDARILVTRYPRGAKELRGVLSKYGPRDTMEWYESRGVPLKVEEDGRVFPVTDDSETIVACLEKAAADARVEVALHDTLLAAERSARGLHVTRKDGTALDARALLLATGSNPAGLTLARKLGHTIIPGVPSLFTFEVKDERIDGLAGVAVPHVRATASVGGATFVQEGPLLITHWGFSAHAVLRLSAWGAREFHAAGYQAKLSLDLVPDKTDEALRARAEFLRAMHGASTLAAYPMIDDLPRRLWERLVVAAGGDLDMRWTEVPKRGVQSLVDQLKRATFQVSGKGPFKEEFVTAGGVARDEVDWRTMESKLVPGLHFAGEVLDVDGLTGGYNFQNSWSTAWLAGTAMATRANVI